MQILKILSGVAVLLTALHFAHAIHHFYSVDPMHGFGFWSGLLLAVIIDILTFWGGYLLLRPGS
jgi:hypothetical protein